MVVSLILGGHHEVHHLRSSRHSPERPAHLGDVFLAVRSGPRSQLHRLVRHHVRSSLGLLLDLPREEGLVEG